MPLDQGRDRKGKRHRKANIAQIQKRRMKGEARILQERVQILPVKGRHGQARERVGGPQDKGKKRHRHRGLHRQHPRAQAWRQIAPEPSRAGAKKRQDQHPKQQRSLMIAPNARDLVDQRLIGVRIRNHQIQREIRGHKRIGERCKTCRGQGELHAGRGRGHSHPPSPAFMRPNQGHDHLKNSHSKGQDQGEMSEFYYHGVNLRPA